MMQMLIIWLWKYCYIIIEKQGLALVKAVKEFKVYILHSHTPAYVPNAAVKKKFLRRIIQKVEEVDG